MSSIREQILVAIVAALNSPAPPTGVPAAEIGRVRGIPPATLPALLVYPGIEAVEPAGSRTSPLMKRRLIVLLEVYAAATPSLAAHQVADPILVHITKRLARQVLMNGAVRLTNDVNEGQTGPWKWDQGQSPYVRVPVQLVVEYSTRATDQELRA